MVGGKGGVGKTTVAAALALALAVRGERTLVLSVDPAHSLGDALGVPVGADPGPVAGVDGLFAQELDAERERVRFLGRHQRELLALLEQTTYLAAGEAEELLELGLPGVDELAAVARLLELAAEERFARLVVDTAPTGHTLRLLSAPSRARRWLAAWERRHARQRAVAEAFSRAPGEDDSGRFLRALDARLADLDGRLADPRHTGLVLVTTPEPVVAAETGRYAAALARAGIALAGIVINRAADGPAVPGPLPGVRAVPAGTPATVRIPPLPADPRGIAALRRLAAGSAAPPPPAPPGGVGLRLREAFRPPADRRLYLVGGKGGVGKTTVSAALAIVVAEASGAPVLLLGADPAGSLGEVWEVPVADTAVRAPSAPGVWLRQTDALASWTAFRREYRSHAGELLVALGDDRQLLDSLLDVAPPGVDELVSLLEVVDLLQGTAYNAVVLDTAPTGHLLRLLQTPEVALEWAHALMRLLLRYREVTGLGGAAEQLLRFARSVRALRQHLRDPLRTWVAVLAAPEALSVPESQRLLARLRSLGLHVDALLINRLFAPGGQLPEPRAAAARSLLRIAGEVAAVGAPLLPRGPCGAAELRAFAGEWRRIALDH